MPFANIQDKRKWDNETKWRRKREFFSEKTCEYCGSMDNLVLHHVNPETKLGSQIWLWGDKRRTEEIDKCIVLCSSCHTRHHNKNRKTLFSRLGGLVKHGTVYAYCARRCRCDECKGYMRDRMRRYRSLGTTSLIE